MKPGGKVGPWGPFRGRLGAHWWIAAIIVGLVVLVAGLLLLLPSASVDP